MVVFQGWDSEVINVGTELLETCLDPSFLSCHWWFVKCLCFAESVQSPHWFSASVFYTANYPIQNIKMTQYFLQQDHLIMLYISIVGFSWLRYCWWFRYLCSQRRLSTVWIMQNRIKGWRMTHCSLRGTGWSCRGPEFDYQYPYVNIQHSVTSVPDDSTSSPGVEHQATTHTNKIKINKSL